MNSKENQTLNPSDKRRREDEDDDDVIFIPVKRQRVNRLDSDDENSPGDSPTTPSKAAKSKRKADVLNNEENESQRSPAKKLCVSDVESELGETLHWGESDAEASIHSSSDEDKYTDDEVEFIEGCTKEGDEEPSGESLGEEEEEVGIEDVRRLRRDAGVLPYDQAVTVDDENEEEEEYAPDSDESSSSQESYDSDKAWEIEREEVMAEKEPPAKELVKSDEDYEGSSSDHDWRPTKKQIKKRRKMKSSPAPPPPLEADEIELIWENRSNVLAGKRARKQRFNLKPYLQRFS